MKKIKLFALAAFAMLSTNAFALTGDKLSTTVFSYTVTDEDKLEAEITGFVADYPAASMATTKIPAEVNHPTEAKAYKVTNITATAFAGNANITAFDFSEAENLATIAAGAFAGTKITSLDLTGTKVAALNQLFETVGCQVAEVKLPATLESIEASAFEGLTKLTSIDFTACTKGITIKANAFKNAMKITSFEVPELVTSIEDEAFVGSYIATLTVNATDKDHAITLGQGTKALGGDKLTTLIVNGANVKISANAFKDVSALTTVTFNADLAAGAVAADAFAKLATAPATYKLTVNYSPSWTKAADVKQGFAATAFGAADAAFWVIFKTTEVFGGACEDLGWKADGTAYGVKLSYTATVPNIPVYKNGGTFAYGGFIAPTGGITISKKQGDANVMVYGAYFDKIGTVAKNSAIIMDQMHLIGGSYYLPEGTKFIVKSSSEDPVEYTAGVKLNGTGADQDSRNYVKGGGTTTNEIDAVAGLDPVAGDYAINVINAYSTAHGSKTYTIYFLRDLADGKAFGWKQREDDSVIKNDQLFLAFEGTAAARIDVIWADGSEEDATAIQTVKKTNAEEGAIYNLSGQKVNAAYKVVVIKKKKKYIQK